MITCDVSVSFPRSNLLCESFLPFLHIELNQVRQQSIRNNIMFVSFLFVCLALPSRITPFVWQHRLLSTCGDCTELSLNTHTCTRRPSHRIVNFFTYHLRAGLFYFPFHPGHCIFLTAPYLPPSTDDGQPS